MTDLRLQRLVRHGYGKSDGGLYNPSLAMHLKPDETADEFLVRVARDFPALTLENCDQYRQITNICAGPLTFRHPHKRLTEFARHLAEVADPLSFALSSREVQAHLGGDGPWITTFLRDFKADLVPAWVNIGQFRTAMRSNRTPIASFLALGLMQKKSANRRVVRFDLPGDNVRGTLLKRLAKLSPERFTMEFLRHYLRVRRAFRLTIMDRHPPAVIERCIDYLLEHGRQPTILTLVDLLGGETEQFHQALWKRHLAGEIRHASTSVRTGRKSTILELEAALPQQLGGLPHTILEPGNTLGSSKITSHALSKLLAFQHPQLFVIGCVVVLYGTASSANLPHYKDALNSLHHLSHVFEGLDPTSSGDVTSVLTAHELITDSLPEFARSSYHHAINWKRVCQIYDSYLALSLPHKLRLYLEKHRPARPIDESIYRRLSGKIQQRLQSNYEERIEKLDDLLETANDMRDRLHRRRAISRSFATQLQEEIKKELALINDERALDAVLKIPVEDEETTELNTITVRVRHWHAIDALVAPFRYAGSSVTDLKRLAKLHTQWNPDLFESRFAIELISVVDPLGRPRPGPYWFEFHRSRLFWPKRKLDDAAMTQRLTYERDAGLNELELAPASGLGNFANERNFIAKIARSEFDMVLLPVLENEHSEAFALWECSQRLDEPTRTGELMQFNLDQGMITEYDDEGEPFAVFRAARKFSQVAHDFVPDKTTEAAADELLELTIARTNHGQPLEPVQAGSSIRKGPREAVFIVTYNGRTLSETKLSIARRLFFAGSAPLRGHDLKYIWNRISKNQGSTLAERQEDQGHKDQRTTSRYNPSTRRERAEAMRVRRGFLNQTHTARHGRPSLDEWTN